MYTLDISKGWKILDIEPGSGNPLELPDVSSWLDVEVPGDVNAALVKAGRMPNPHFGDNGRNCYWVTGREWWYRLEFSAGETAEYSHTDLILNRIDGFADVFLNGEKVGRTENDFREHKINVTGKLRSNAPNVLLLRFQSIDEIMGGQRKHELGGWYDRRTLMRKPQFNFGWDWSLPLPSIGIGAPVKLELHNGPRLLDISIQTFISGRIDFKFHVNTAARDAGYYLNIKVSGYGSNVSERLERNGRVYSYTTIQINNPHLWWPNGMGDPSLYNYSVELVVNGEIVDSCSGRFGIREVRLVEEPFTKEAGPGISMWFEVNRKRIFAKGGNWIPLELWPAMATEEQYKFYISKAADANFNMLRVWGGGIVEPDLFYNLCDESGIMVWQDFMFASAGYPVELLRQEIIAESEYVVKHLRNHPCIALWCGCNEDVYSWSLPDEDASQMADTGVYSQSTQSTGAIRLRDDPQIYSMILRGTVGRLGLGVPYTESSPQSYDDAGNMPESGNCHISCWKYAMFGSSRSNMFDDKALANHNPNHEIDLFKSDSEPQNFRKHFEKVCSFDSEFCIQGPCDIQSLKQFLPAEHQWPPDDMWIYHIQRGHANIPHHHQTMFIAGAIFGEINSLQEYVKHGQSTHAEMMRAEFESARRDRPNNGGTMMWSFNDCWPTSNWSIIDYYRRPKPSYYAAKRACAKYLPIIFERGGNIEFFISNDGNESCKASLTFGQEHLDGTKVWTTQKNMNVNSCATLKFYSIVHDELNLAEGDYLYIDTEVNGSKLSRITYFPMMWKNVKWPVPEVKLEVLDQIKVEVGWITKVRITTDAYTRFLHLIIDDEAKSFWLDDNFFDLCKGDSRSVLIQSQEKVEPKEILIGHWHTDWP